MARIQELAMARGSRRLLLLAILAGLAAAALVFLALAQSDSGGGPTPGPALASKAVVADQNIKAGTTISAEMVVVLDVPQDLLIPGAFADTTNIIGKQARYPIAKGDLISPSKIGVEAGGDGLQYVLPPGKRAMSVEVREVTAVGGLLLPGNRVDLIVTFVEDQGTDTAADDVLVVMTILRDVEVLAVAQSAQEAVPVSESTTDPVTEGTTSGAVPEDTKVQPGAGTVTVALDPVQVELVACVQDLSGVERVWASLRPFGEAPPVVPMEVPGECVID